MATPVDPVKWEQEFEWDGYNWWNKAWGTPPQPYAVVGPQGPPGARGQKGDPGETLKVTGVVPDAAGLPNAPALLTVLMSKDNGHIYIYDPTSKAAADGRDPKGPPKGWVDMGKIAGPQGIQGEKGDKPKLTVKDVNVGTDKHFIDFILNPDPKSKGDYTVDVWLPPGPQGKVGPQGPQGTPGSGVPKGGLTGQALIKASDDDDAVTWGEVSSVPDGGWPDDQLFWDDTTDSWMVKEGTIENHSDVVGSPSEGNQALMWDDVSGVWSPKKFNVNEAGDVVEPFDGKKHDDVLTWDDGLKKWIAAPAVSRIRTQKDFLDTHDVGTWRSGQPIVWSETQGKFYVGNSNVNVDNWNPKTIYNVRDIVEHKGEIWMCLPQDSRHTSSLGDEPGGNGDKFWVKLKANVHIWQPGEDYPAGTIVAVPQHQEYWNDGNVDEFKKKTWDPQTVYQFYIAAYDVHGSTKANAIDKQSPGQVPPGYVWWETYDLTNGSLANRRRGAIVSYVDFWQPLEGTRTFIFDDKKILDSFGDTDGNYREGDIAVVFGPHDTRVYKWKPLEQTPLVGTNFWTEEAILDIHGNASGGPIIRFHTTDEMRTIDTSALSQFQRAYVQVGDDGEHPEIWQYIKTPWDNKDPGWYFVYRLDFVDSQVHRHDLELIASSLGDIIQELGFLQTGVRHMAAVKSRASKPPAVVIQGDSFIVKAVDGVVPLDGEGDFKGHLDAIAEYDGASWRFSIPTKGDAHYVQDVKETWIWSGTEWVKASDNGGATSLVSLDDVQAKTPRAGNSLVYDATLKKWVARDIATMEMGRWYTEGQAGGLYHSHDMLFPSIANGSTEYCEFLIDFRAINMTHTTMGYPELMFTFKSGRDHSNKTAAGLKDLFVDGSWMMQAYSSWEYSKEDYTRGYNVKKDRINTGVPTQSGGWVIGTGKPINGYFRISRNLYKTAKTTIEWDWMGPSVNPHFIYSRGWVTLNFPIEDIYAVQLTNQGQESIFATRFTNLTPDLGSAEPHLVVSSKTDFDGLAHKDNNTLYLIRQGS